MTARSEKEVEFLVSKDFKKFYLQKRGLSQVEFAKLMGYKESQVSAILNGNLEPSMAFLRKMCYVCRLNISDFIETKFNKIYNGRAK